MELAISTEHHPEHANAPEQLRYQLFTFPWYIFSLSCWTGYYPITCSQLTAVVQLCRVAVTVKRTAGEVNYPDNTKLLDVAFTLGVLC